MKLPRLQFLLATICSVLFFSAAFTAAGGDVKADIEALEKKWSAALAANDSAAVSQLLADDWTNVTEDGAVQTKAEFIDSLKSGSLKFTNCTLKKVAVRVFGDTAVVVGEDSSKGVQDGEAFDDESVFTDVWVKKGDQWVCVATHSSDVED